MTRWSSDYTAVQPAHIHPSIYPSFYSVGKYSLRGFYVSASLPDVILGNTEDDRSSALKDLALEGRRQAVNTCMALCAI